MAEDAPQFGPPRPEPARRPAAGPRLGPRLLVSKVLVLVLLAALGAILSRNPGVHEWLGHGGRLARELRGLGQAAVPAFFLGSALLICLGVPRLVFCPVAGAAFGFWGGLLVSTASTMAAYVATFLFIRGRLADSDQPVPLPAALSFLRHDPGISGVILTRLLPVPGLLGTIALSLCPVRTRSFLAGSLVGLIPEAVPFLLLGAGLFDGNPRQLAWMTAGALLVLLASWLLVRHLLKRHRISPRRPDAG